MSDLFYRFWRTFARPLHAVCRIHYSGLEHIPKTGPGLLAGNHISHIDPPLLAILIQRPVDFISSAEFFVNPLSRFIFNQLNAIPIDRNRRDLIAVKASLAQLEKGRLVGLFVEGGIRHGATSLLGGAPLKESSTALARVAHAPIIPFILLGADQLYQWRAWFRRPRLFIRFGEPIPTQPEEDRHELAIKLAERLRRLFEELQTEYKITPEELPHSAQERWAAK